MPWSIMGFIASKVKIHLRGEGVDVSFISWQHINPYTAVVALDMQLYNVHISPHLSFFYNKYGMHGNTLCNAELQI